MQVDIRAGSGDLIPLLMRRGVKPVEAATLGYGDVAILGNGPEGMPVNVGVEVKKLPDLLQCIGNGRFAAHQLPGMLECYDQVWLLVEGIWRDDGHGNIEVPRGRGWSSIVSGNSRGFSANALTGFLFTMSSKLNLKVWHTGTRGQTVDWLYALNRWWTGKEWDEHKSHLVFDNSSALSAVSRPSLCRRVAKELPGIGWERSADVARRFPTVTDMVLAGVEDWQGIKGIGKTTAKRVVEAINGE